MRTWIATVVFSVLASAAAHAADLTDPVWAQAPERADWAKAYPGAAAASGVSGDVKLRCTATAAGALDGCQVVQETPAAYGFGAAALSLTAQMQLKPTAMDGKPVAGRSIDVPVRFVPELLHPGTIVSQPDWLRRPSADELGSFLPADAQGVPGSTRITCVVTGRGLLDKCSIADEAPKGHGFGAAALAMSELFVMRPMTVDGLPIGGGEVTIPISFLAGSNGGAGSRIRGAEQTRISVLRTAPWVATPTAADLAGAFPRDAIGKISADHVVLRCGLHADGGLSDCETIGWTPDRAPFFNAARSLIPHFRAIVGPHDQVSNFFVDVPFDFRDLTNPSPPLEIYDPKWLVSINPDAVARLFPPQAVKAGLDEGRARLQCEVAHDGTLTDCSVASESPAGLGFGAAALQIAAVMRMNPWTEQGTPVDGARIVLPIKLVLPADEPVAAASANPPPGAPATSAPPKP